MEHIIKFYETKIIVMITHLLPCSDQRIDPAKKELTLLSKQRHKNSSERM